MSFCLNLLLFAKAIKGLAHQVNLLCQAYLTRILSVVFPLGFNFLYPQDWFIFQIWLYVPWTFLKLSPGQRFTWNWKKIKLLRRKVTVPNLILTWVWKLFTPLYLSTEGYSTYKHFIRCVMPRFNLLLI